MAGSPVVLVPGLGGVEGMAELAAAFGDDDLGFRRRWTWSPGEDGSGIDAAEVALEFGLGSRRWAFAVRFAPAADSSIAGALVTIASGQVFSFADEGVLLPLMLDIDPAFLGAVGETVGGTLELALAVSAFADMGEAEAASRAAAEAMGKLGFVWRLQGGSSFVLVAVAFSRAGAEEGAAAMAAGGGEAVLPDGPLREAIEARLWPGVEEGAAEAAGDRPTAPRGALLLEPGGTFAPFGPEVG